MDPSPAWRAACIAHPVRYLKYTTISNTDKYLSTSRRVDGGHLRRSRAREPRGWLARAPYPPPSTRQARAMAGRAHLQAHPAPIRRLVGTRTARCVSGRRAYLWPHHTPAHSTRAALALAGPRARPALAPPSSTLKLPPRSYCISQSNELVCMLSHTIIRRSEGTVAASKKPSSVATSASRTPGSP